MRLNFSKEIIIDNSLVRVIITFAIKGKFNLVNMALIIESVANLVISAQEIINFAHGDKQEII